MTQLLKLNKQKKIWYTEENVQLYKWVHANTHNTRIHALAHDLKQKYTIDITTERSMSRLETLFWAQWIPEEPKHAIPEMGIWELELCNN